MKPFDWFVAGLIVALIAMLVIAVLQGCSSKFVTTDELKQLGWQYKCDKSFHGSTCRWEPPPGI